MQLNTDPLFASEAQAVFTAGDRVYTVAGTICAGEGSEGTYRGHLNERLAVVDWDTPNGEGFRESVSFDSIRQLYV